MPTKRDYLFDIIPRWLRYSGLPKYINDKFGRQAWNIFSCLISMDCRFNPDHPDWFAQSYEELGNLTGLSRKTISGYIKKFHDTGLIDLIKGEFRSLKSKFRIITPLVTPIDPDSIKAVNGGYLFLRAKKSNLRYYNEISPTAIITDDKKGEDEKTKGGNLGTESVSHLPYYKNDYKMEKEDVIDSNASSSSLVKSKPVTFKEGKARMKKIKEILKTNKGLT